MASEFSFGDIYYYELKVFKLLTDDDFWKPLYRKTIAVIFIFQIISYMFENITYTIQCPTVAEFAYNMRDASSIVFSCICCCYVLIFRKDFVEVYNTMVTEEMFLPRNIDGVKVITTGLSLYKKVRGLLVVVTILLEIAVAINGSQRNDVLPTPMWIPMDVNYAPCFALIYVRQMINLTVLILSYLFITLAEVGYTSFVATQSDLICENLENLPSHEKSLKKIIERHIRLLQLSNKMGSLLSPVFFVVFFYEIGYSATTVFYMSKATDEKFWICVYYIIFAFICTLTQCWFLDEMKRRTELMLTAAYNCPWVDAEPSFKKELIIFMQNTQNPIEFRSSGMVPLSLDTFIEIVKAVFSYYTILQNFENM